MATPVIQIASIGTQITEAFAGLDRIREIRQMATEDAGRRGTRAARRRRAARSSSTTCGSSTTPGVPVLKRRLVPRAGRLDDGAGRLERLGQEHADQPGDGVQPADVGARAASTAATSTTLRLRDYRAHLGVVLQDNFLFDGTIAENIALRASRTRRATRSRRSAASRTATSSSRSSRRATTRSSASAACGCRAASGSAWRSRARSSPTRAS